MDNCIDGMSSEFKQHEKTKATSKETITGGTEDKPVYSIKYFVEQFEECLELIKQ